MRYLAAQGLVLKTERVMQQTGDEICIEIGLRKNFAQKEDKPEFLQEECVSHTDQTLQSGAHASKISLNEICYVLQTGSCINFPVLGSVIR